VHAALDDGVLDAEHFGDLGFHFLCLEVWKLRVSPEIGAHYLSLTLRAACLGFVLELVDCCA
jgi:hypothetical protein